MKLTPKNDFVLTRDGSKDFGEISATVATAIRHKEGKIRMRIGEHDDITGRGYGAKHIERSNRMAQLQGAGFNSARDFVQYVLADYDAIYEGGNGALIVARSSGGRGLVVTKLQLFDEDEQDFYDVETAYIYRKDNFRNKKPLWEKPESGL
jgi:hypothetical protein